MALKTEKNAKIYRRNAELRTMTEKVIQKIIKLMPLILLIMLVFLDRNDTIHVVGFLLLLFFYTGILIARILYAKKMWHVEFGKDDLSRDPSVNKMGDLMDKLDRTE